LYIFIQNECPPNIISSNTVRAPTRPKKQDKKVYLEGLAVSAALLKLLDYAMELDRVEEVVGPSRPELYLQHQECSRLAKQTQRSG
jgi:hypothetical protein